MALVLQLLLLLLSGIQGDLGSSLEGLPGDKVNLSCVGVSHPIRWAWAPSFPACQGLSKGRRPILWASSSGNPTTPPVQTFVGRLRALDPSIRRLELLLRAGDSGTFFCRGRHEDESRTVLHVLGDRADCRVPGSRHALSPAHSSTRERQSLEDSKGRGAPAPRRPGSGAEPALRGPGPYGSKKPPPAVPSGLC
ncbi:megakaryocyte and platelet inhibitory receptor G6b isoform X3 [Tamandua tetradactyla]|uniref:megakaryocyte and platelet inhibitory receptor G6b isoform X3 n=1 Tax=Tamandua tetradactyla TaxID=48850 RepID=UPI00405408F4